VTKAILKALDRAPIFQLVVAGGEYRWIKPHPMLFGIITDHVRVAPHHLVVVSDNWQDIECGRGEGAHTVGVLGRYGDPIRLRQAQPDIVILSIRDLPQVICARARHLLEMEGKPINQ
jgi:beta-phosphoglucomutase-like phosphatase (HAD superfamily)